MRLVGLGTHERTLTEGWLEFTLTVLSLLGVESTIYRC